MTGAPESPRLSAEDSGTNLPESSGPQARAVANEFDIPNGWIRGQPLIIRVQHLDSDRVLHTRPRDYLRLTFDDDCADLIFMDMQLTLRFVEWWFTA